MNPITVGIIGIVVMITLLMFRVWIGAAMMLVGIVGFALLSSARTALEMAGVTAYGTMADYNFTVVPLFVLMGEIAYNARISSDLYATANKWIGQLRGGLAMATVWACAGFAAICGSSVAAAATMGTVTLPEMEKHGYDESLRAGCVAAGGTLGILIPPSMGFIVYGIITNVSIGALFIAGIIPGIVLATLFTISIAIQTHINPKLAPIAEKSTLKEKLLSLTGLLDMLVLFLLVIGGLFVGIFTPTEAGAVGAFGAIVLSLIRKRLTLKGFTNAIMETALTTGMVFFILIGAMIFNRFLAISSIPAFLSDWVGNLPLPPVGILIVILFIYLVLGCIIDSMAMILLTIPIFFPVAMAIGFDPLWFGVITVIAMEMGLITPPVGMNVYVVSGVARGISLQVIFKGIFPFLIMMIIMIIILILFPDIATFLPRFMM